MKSLHAVSLVVAVFVFTGTAIPLAGAVSECDGARSELIAEVNDPTLDLGAITRAFGAVVEACGVDDQSTDDEETCILVVCLPQMQLEDVKPECGATPVTLAPQAASFTVTIWGATPTPQHLPDAGSAVVGVSGGNGNPTAWFDGDGIFSGVLASEDGAWSFPKVRTVLLPGQDGDADVTCPADSPIPTGGWGTAFIAAGGFKYEVKGETLL